MGCVYAWWLRLNHPLNMVDAMGRGWAADSSHHQPTLVPGPSTAPLIQHSISGSCCVNICPADGARATTIA